MGSVLVYDVMTCCVDVAGDDVMCCLGFFFLMIRRPPRSTQSRSSAASDVYKRQGRQTAPSARFGV